MDDITLLQALEGFFRSNKQSYYLITDRDRVYNTFFRVDDLDTEAINMEEFILENFSAVEFGYRDGEDRFDFFTAERKQYSLFGYDFGVISI